MLFSCFTVNVI